MKIKIAENIRALRKQNSFTQEQLAEALGVTVSAVYKWESGQSVPEVKMLMELADLFEISVDTLLGYDRQNENVENRIKRIEQYIAERNFEEAVIEAEKALKKYPNKFEVVYVAASVYMLIYSEKKSESAMKKAIELFYSAIPLLYQNKESSISEMTILKAIGNLYITDGQQEKGLEILKKNNICGINSDIIGLTYAMMKKTEEAKPYLYQAYANNLNSIIRTMSGMMFMYSEQKDGVCMEIGKWLMNYLDSIVDDKNKITFIDKLKAILSAQMAVIVADLGKHDEADMYIRDAYQYASKFDAAPNYSPQDIKFLFCEEKTALLLDGLGETALEAVENFVFKRENNGNATEYIKNKFEVLKNEGFIK